MSQTPEKKNRFQISREVQEEFVNGIAETMLSVAEAAGKGYMRWIRLGHRPASQSTEKDTP